MDISQIVSNIHPLAVDIRQISILYSPAQIALKYDVLEYIVKPDTICTVWRSRKAQQQARAEVRKDRFIRFGGGVMRFIANNDIKIVLAEPF